ncbi:MAG: D-glycero-beta-D-manno-heptose-7-phosphate kinase [Candidatus Nealsonbacteria bacterium]
MENYSNILQKFKNPKVLVVGDLMLDEYLLGNVDRISPEAPIPVLDVKEINFRLGGAANTAYNIKSLGDNVFLAGVVGSDEKGGILKKILAERGINHEGVMVDSQRKTTIKTRVVAQNQQIVRIDIEDRNPIAREIEEKIAVFVKEKIKDFNAIIISDYAKGVVTKTLSQRIIALARENNVFSIIDPKGTDVLKYKGCNIIAPNKKELGIALNIPFEQLAQEGRFFQAAKMLMAHAMSDSVLVKCGAEGMVLFEKNGNISRFPALNKKVIDVSGAGDTAIGVFSLAVAGGANYQEAAVLASNACAIKVGKRGTDVVLPEELEAILRNYDADQKQN